MEAHADVTAPPPRRFARCALVELRAPDGRVLEAPVATTPLARLLGLARIEPQNIGALLLPRCDAVHGFWMLADLDVCFLAMPARDASPATVLAVRVLRRGRSIALAHELRHDVARRRVAALELPAGAADRLGIAAGTTLAVRHPGAVRT